MCLYADVEVRKQQLEQTLKHMRQLFKPWPPHKEGETAETKSENTSESTQNHIAVGEVISPEEQAELDMVNRLLNKAQKARYVQKKLEEPRRPRGTINHRHTKSENVPDNTASIKSTGANSAGTGSVGPKALSKKHIHTVSSNPQSNTLCDKESKALGRKPAETVKTENSQPASREASGKQKQAKLTKTIQGRPIVERPQSGFGKKRVVPAHVSAPFQTNPRVPSKVQTTYQAATMLKSGSAGRGRNSGIPNRGTKSASRIPGQSARRVSSHQQQTKFVTSDKLLNKNQNHYSEDVDYDQDDSGNENMTEEEEQTVTEPSKQTRNSDINKAVGNTEHEITNIMNSVHIGDQGKGKHLLNEASKGVDGTSRQEGDSPEGQSGKERFLLVRDGSSLTLPPRLRKLVSQNRKLREKLYAQSVTTKVNSPTAEFPSQLQHSFGTAEDTQVQQLGRQLQHILSTDSHLHTLLSSLHLETITEESPLEDIIRARKLLEYILATFQETEELVHSLDCTLHAIMTKFARTYIQMRWLKMSNLINIYKPGLLHTATVSDSCPHEVNRRPDVPSLSVWYKKSKKIPGMSSSLIVTYRSYKELEKFRSLVFKAQLVQAQLEIMESAHQTMLPIIRSLDPDTSEYVQALQCGYAMLSANPNRVPVIVRDNAEDGSDL